MGARPERTTPVGGYFGQEFANIIRRRLPRPGDKWYMDEVVLKIAGKKHYFDRN